MLALLSAVAAFDYGKRQLGDKFGVEMQGDSFSFDDLDVPSQTIPAGARVKRRLGRGDITLRGTDDQQLRVSAKKNVHAWSENEAGKIAKPVNVVVVKNGDGYEIHPDGYDLSDSRISLDVEIAVPKKSPVIVRTDKGDVAEYLMSRRTLKRRCKTVTWRSEAPLATCPWKCARAT